MVSTSSTSRVASTLSTRFTSTRASSTNHLRIESTSAIAERAANAPPRGAAASGAVATATAAPPTSRADATEQVPIFLGFNSA
jgi:hypothetical protein